jgi:hypothetical protein
VVKDDTQINPATADPPFHAAAPTPMRVNAEHDSIFGFRPILKKDPTSGTSNAVANHSRDEVPDEVPDSEPDKTMGFVIIFFLSFFISL